MVPLAVIGGMALSAGALVFIVGRRRGPRPPGATSTVVAERVVETTHAEAMLRDDRISPQTATGVGLVVAVVALALTGLAVGVLAFLIRVDASFLGFDRAVERWAQAAATPTSDAVLGWLTHLGGTVGVIVVGLVVAAWAAVRHRGAAAFAFLALVIAGQAIIVNLIKVGVERARPALAPRASFSGQSFPSGHATAAAACFLGIALVLAIGRAPRARTSLLAAGVAIGVAVAGTRVLLGVHWTSDAVAGLAIGWSWCLVVSEAFGGRLLRFGAAVETAAAHAASDADEAAMIEGSRR